MRKLPEFIRLRKLNWNRLRHGLDELSDFLTLCCQPMQKNGKMERSNGTIPGQEPTVAGSDLCYWSKKMRHFRA